MALIIVSAVDAKRVMFPKRAGFGPSRMPSACAAQRRGRTVSQTPPCGRRVRIICGSGVRFGTGSKRKRASRVDRMITASCRAKLATMQMHGPAPIAVGRVRETIGVKGVRVATAGGTVAPRSPRFLCRTLLHDGWSHRVGSWFMANIRPPIWMKKPPFAKPVAAPGPHNSTCHGTGVIGTDKAETAGQGVQEEETGRGLRDGWESGGVAPARPWWRDPWLSASDMGFRSMTR
ncbi:hypothetical protein PARHAE_04094 [Paracoccus haematequi]|uniref:Uncharacterized protein n=1 Tax=Paracoccus haematequi TaxID=2491866 RepID=A0A447ITM3_9RHOB|nr:hypothetical protein PARHAE_04094 [Paracoccus haematequi]